MIIIIVYIKFDRKAKGVKMRYSRQRTLVEKIMKSRYDHPTADMVYETARGIEPNISLGTVYRNLKTLSDDGVIDTLETVDKKVHYDGNKKPHIHFICTDCGSITDVYAMPNCPDELRGYEVTESKCVYYGKCADCRNKENMEII